MPKLTKLDIGIIIILALVLVVSLNQERYFQTMKGDVIGISGDALALEDKGYGLELKVKGYSGYSKAEVEGILIAATKEQLYLYNGSVVKICNEPSECDVIPMVIRAYAVEQDKRTVQMEGASISEILERMTLMHSHFEIGPLATIYFNDLEIQHATIDEIKEMDPETIIDRCYIVAISLKYQYPPRN